MSSNNNKKSALGRGLSALLENPVTDITTKGPERETSAVAGGIATIPVGQIEVNPFQPRIHFEEEALTELADSIKVHGIIQPITVRKMGYDKYQLISGERRFRASQLAGLESIPAYVRIANDQSMLEMALVENIQRENLDAIEVAISYKRLIDECNLTQEELSKKVSKERSTVTNYLRLLKLPVEIQLGIREKAISMGHARALISVEDPSRQIAIYHEIVESGLSVRQAEELAKGTKESGATATKMPAQKKQPAEMSFRHQKITDDLREALSVPVELKVTKGKGKIMIPFDSEDDLDRILELLSI